MATKTRFQNPTVGDTVLLDLFVYNSNNFASVCAINQINIYYLDEVNQSAANPDGRTLVETISGTSVTNPTTGKYELSLYLNPTLYLYPGRYIDEWDVVFLLGDPVSTINNLFIIYPELWYTTPEPIVYDFNFYFQPNRMRLGSKYPIVIEVTTNVPTASDLANYYVNLAIGGQLYVYIGVHCDPCAPCDDLIVDGDLIPFFEKNRAYYTVNTDDFDPGLYDVWFKLLFGTNTYISDKAQLLIYE